MRTVITGIIRAAKSLAQKGKHCAIWLAGHKLNVVVTAIALYDIFVVLAEFYGSAHVPEYSMLDGMTTPARALTACLNLVLVAAYWIAVVENKSKRL